MNMYQRVLEEEIPSCRRDYNLINSAIRTIKKVYRRISSNTPLPEIDYNDVNYRYAYIYLFSTCHMAAVEECVKELDFVYFKKMMKRNHEKFSVCSLGGGPGSDAFGLLKASLWRNELRERVRVCIVDLCEGWATTLRYALNAISKVYLRKMKRCKIEGCFIQQDLCDTLSPSVVDEIETCDILSLVKVVSVVSNYYKRHPEELENIFNSMKPGSWIFFLDNSEDGFYEIVSNAAEDAGLVLAIPPKTARRSVTNCLSTEHFFTEPLSRMPVCFAVWEKSAYSCLSSTSSSPSSSSSDEDCDEALLYQLYLLDDDDNVDDDDDDGTICDDEDGNVYHDNDDDSDGDDGNAHDDCNDDTVCDDGDDNVYDDNDNGGCGGGGADDVNKDKADGDDVANEGDNDNNDDDDSGSDNSYDEDDEGDDDWLWWLWQRRRR